MADLPPWKAREPWNQEAAQAVIEKLWAREDYRQHIREAFAQCASPHPNGLMLSRVEGVESLWVSYVIDEERHKLLLASIDDASKLDA